MYLYEEHDFYSFKRQFETMGRENQYTSAGFHALYDYIQALAIDTGKPIKVDVIGICCEYAETSASTLAQETGHDTVEELQDDTWAVELDNGNIIYGVV